MTRAEQRALEAYPHYTAENLDDVIKARKFFAKGYSQAEKDLALTWEDMSIICEAFVDVNYEFDYHSLQEKYEEILRRFNKAKEEKK